LDVVTDDGADDDVLRNAALLRFIFIRVLDNSDATALRDMDQPGRAVRKHYRKHHPHDPLAILRRRRVMADLLARDYYGQADFGSLVRMEGRLRKTSMQRRLPLPP